MSKITFRADDDLVAQLESLEASKSEAMREALRAYLDTDSTAERDRSDSIDDLVRDRVDERLRDLGLEIDRAGTRSRERSVPERQDVTVTISLEGPPGESTGRQNRPRKSTPADDERAATHVTPEAPAGGRDGCRQCNQCGDRIDDDHVYCPNCGEKAARRLFCDCGDEVRSDWSFCPSCGRRTPAADVLESDRSQR